MTYPGGKHGAGVYQAIINRMPPHEVSIEPFLGGGAVMRHKRPARLNLGMDLDPEVIRQWQARIAGNGERAGLLAAIAEASVQIREGDGIAFLSSYPFTGRELVYCDPPYLHATRSTTKLYRFEMDDTQHTALLETINALPCMVLISGDWSALYACALTGWTSVSFQAMTRGGRLATEWLWSNEPEPVALHDDRYLGKDFRERERIRRKQQRWVRRLQALPVLERRALLAALAEAWPRSSPDPATPDLVPSPAMTSAADTATYGDARG